MNGNSGKVNVAELEAKYPKRFQREYYEWCGYAADYEWWDCAYEGFKEDAKAYGFEVEDITFSGFGSQGDGAAWNGEVDVVKFLKAKNLDTEPMWFALMELARLGWIDDKASVAHSWRYSYTTQVHDFAVCSSLDEDSIMETGVFAGMPVLALLNSFGVDDAIDELVDLIDGEVEDFAKDIYRSLEKEFEHITSEESFRESCECNDVTFEVNEGEL